MNKYLSTKIKNINYIMTVMIVVLHSSALRFIPNQNGVVGRIFKIINTFCDSAVPAFFCMSAYLFYKNFEIVHFKQKLKKRIRSLLIPYFMWGIIFLIYYKILSLVPGIENKFDMGFDLSNSNIIFNILFATCAQTMWFIRVLFLYVLITPLFEIIFRIFKKKSIIFVVIFLIINIMYRFGYSSVIFWLPIYFFGAYCGKFYTSYIEKNNKPINISKNTIIILSIFSIIISYIISFYDEYSIVYYLYRMFSPIILFSLLNCFLNSYTKQFKFANMSFCIFCIHLPIIQIVRKSLIIIVGNGEIKSLFIFIVTIISTLFICYLVYYILNKIMPRVLSLLVGGR